jgi:hypothetical protein
LLHVTDRRDIHRTFCSSQLWNASTQLRHRSSRIANHRGTGRLVSARVRAIVAALRPVVVHVLTFWDHVVRSISVGRRRIEVDPSGSYRMR